MPLTGDKEWQRFRRFGGVCLIALSMLVFLGVLYRSIMVAFVAGAIIAYTFDPLIIFLCRRYPLSRKTMAGILVFLAVALCALLAILIGPFIYEELTSIISRVPEALNYAERLMIPVLSWLKEARIFPEETIEAGFRRLNLLQSMSSASQTVQEIFLRTPVVLEAVFNLAMVPLITYLLLAGKENIVEGLRRWTPRDTHALMSTFIHRVDVVLRSVVKGQFLIAFILGLFYMVGFHLIGVPSGIAIGALAGICRLVPYLDVVVGIVLCSIVVLTQGIGAAVFVAVLGVVAVVQSLDGMIITPRIIGDRAGLHPIVVIASVFAFGSWFGLLGVLLAVPTVAATVVAVHTCFPYVQKSPFFQRSDLLAADSSEAQRSEQN